jgi:hypothetical protein
MIEYKGGNKVLLSFEDWSSEMMILASKLHRLPKPDAETGDKTHEVGIDKLSNLPRGREAIEALFDLSDDLNYCPDYEEVVWLGRVVIKTNMELDALLAKRRRDRVGLQEKRRKRTTPIRTTGPIGFTRGN